MKLARAIATVLLSSLPGALGAGNSGVHLSREHESFLIEDDIVYARCLDLKADGTYQQINHAEHGSAEVDRGTWEQSATGNLRLHATQHALRFHALLAGPLSLAPNSQAKREALDDLRLAIVKFLGSSGDDVFSPEDVLGICIAIGEGVAFHIDVAPDAATCSRRDLQDLARQIDDFVRTERTNIYVLVACKMSDAPPVFALEDATFQAGDLARVKRVYAVTPAHRLPFYFVLVNARTFAREVGSWQVPRPLGSPE